MPIAIKTKPTSAEVKPWDRLGMSYQKYNYQRKKGLLPDLGSSQIDPVGQFSQNNGNTQQNQQNQQVSQVSQDTLLRYNILLDEFLGRCEGDQSIAQQGCWISQPMAAALYHIIRQDGH